MNDFFAMIYELGGELYFNEFSTSLFDKEIYAQIGMYTVGLVIVSVLLYYYGVGLMYPRLNRGIHWVLWMLITAAIAYFMMDKQVDAFMIIQGTPDYNISYLFQLSLVNAVFSSVVFFLFSFVRKIVRKTQYTNTPF